MPKKRDISSAHLEFSLRLALRLKELRCSRCLTQEQVAGRAGLSEKTYQRYEKGWLQSMKPVNPEFFTLVSLAMALGIEVSELLDFEGMTIDPEVLERFLAEARPDDDLCGDGFCDDGDELAEDEPGADGDDLGPGEPGVDGEGNGDDGRGAGGEPGAEREQGAGGRPCTDGEPGACGRPSDFDEAFMWCGPAHGGDGIARGGPAESSDGAPAGDSGTGDAERGRLYEEGMGASEEDARFIGPRRPHEDAES